MVIEDEFSVQQVSEDQSNSQEKGDNTMSRPSRIPTLPNHLEQVFNVSKEHLSQEESSQLSNLLIEYQDVFAQSEFDLGNYRGIEHSIDTG